MTDALPPPEEPSEPPNAEPEPGAERIRVVEPPARRRRDPLPLLFGIGFIVLLAAVFYLWQHPLGQHLFPDQGKGGEAAPAVQPASAAQLAALQQQVTATRQQLAALQQQAGAAQQQAQAAQQQAASARQAVQAAADQAQAARRQAQVAGRAETDLAQRIAVLEKRPVPAAPDLGPLEARIGALEKQAAQPPKPAPLPPEVTALGLRFDTLAGRLDQIAGRQEQLSTQMQQLAAQQQHVAAQVDRTDAATAKRLDGIEVKVGAVSREAGKLSGLADQAGRIGRIQAAEAALDAGLPIGELPGAPPALARFATTPPPTVASLRLAFPAAAQAAAAAAQPQSTRSGFWNSVKGRFESLVTVRRGDQVLVGNPVDAVIAHAARALDAGDLATAVSDISDLKGAPAQAFTEWHARALALLDARKALAAMAAQSAPPQAAPAEHPARIRT